MFAFQEFVSAIRVTCADYRLLSKYTGNCENKKRKESWKTFLVNIYWEKSECPELQHYLRKHYNPVKGGIIFISWYVIFFFKNFDSRTMKLLKIKIGLKLFSLN